MLYKPFTFVFAVKHTTECYSLPAVCILVGSHVVGVSILYSLYGHL